MKHKYREDKTTQAAARLLLKGGGTMNYMKLMKLLYLADRESLLSLGRPITFDEYYSLKYGPILSATLELITLPNYSGVHSDWNATIERQGQYNVQLRQMGEIPNDQLSDAEEGILDQINEKWGHLNEWDLVEITHNVPEYRDPEGSRLPITIGHIMRASGLSAQEVQEYINDLEAESSFERLSA